MQVLLVVTCAILAVLRSRVILFVVVHVVLKRWRAATTYPHTTRISANRADG